MPRFSPISVFLLRFALLFSIMAIPWPGSGKAYSVYFRVIGRLAFRDDDAREVSFETSGSDSKRPFDTRVIIVNRRLMHPDGSGPVRNVDFDAESFGWKPTALLIALILATPVSGRRRVAALLLGLLCLHGVLLLCLGFLIWIESAEIGLVALTPYWKALANNFNEAVLSQITIPMPLLIWILVTFRREDKTKNPSIYRYFRSEQC